MVRNFSTRICLTLYLLFFTVATLGWTSEPKATVKLDTAHELLGDWSLDLQSRTPAWMRLEKPNGRWNVQFRLYVGTSGPHHDVRFANGRLMFTLRQNKKATSKKTVTVGITGGKLDGVVVTTQPDGTSTEDRFTGTRIPPIASVAPDLSHVRFGKPISLFNGIDLTGWRPHEPDKEMGWSAIDGALVNNTPKTDFSATGTHANLRTVSEFEDFWLHLEFNIGQARNSGIYLRGMYEAQVVDRNSSMQGKYGVGAIFGLIEPSSNAGKLGGHWQTYDLLLVDRHITVELNGIKVIDNQAVSQPTAGAVITDPMQPGPIYLQGDHTSVKYRNLYLAPVVKF